MKALLSPSESLLITETLCKLNDYLLAKLAAVYGFGSYGLGSKVVNAQLRFGKQSRLLTILIAVVVLLLLGAPLVVLFLTSLRPPSALPLDPGISLDNFATIFSSPRMLTVLVNTAIYGAGALVLSLTLGAIIAFLVERTDIPFRSTIYSAMLVSLAVPTMLKAFGWVLLLSPGLGWINYLLRQSFGMEGASGPLNIYTMTGMIFVTGIGLSNNAFLMLSPLFRQMNPEFEEAAQTSGSKGLTVLRKVTLPLLLPGLLSALIYFGMVLVQVMETALAIGVPGGHPCSERAHLSADKSRGWHPSLRVGGGLRCGLAAARAVADGSLFLANPPAGSIQRRHRKILQATPAEIGPLEIPCVFFRDDRYCLLRDADADFGLGKPCESLSSAIFRSLEPGQSAKLFPHTGQSTSAAKRGEHIDTHGDRADTRGLHRLLRQLVLGKRKMRWVEVFAITPMGVPNVVLALALFLIYVMTPIHGSIWVLIIAHIIAHLPFTTRVLSAALLQLHKELEEAAHVTGATTARTLRTVTIPLILPAVVNGWLWAFSATLRDFTFAIFLMTGRNMVLPSAMWVLWNVPDISGTAALGTVYMCGFVFVTIAARSVDQRQRKKAGWEVG